jgi:hypothetical protein
MSTVNYRLTKNPTNKKRIEDYLEMKNGKYVLKPQFVKKYTLFNSLGLFEDD